MPVPDWTLNFEEKGTKRIEIVGLGDKRQNYIVAVMLSEGKVIANSSYLWRENTSMLTKSSKSKRLVPLLYR